MHYLSLLSAGFQISKGKIFKSLPRIVNQWYIAFGIKPSVTATTTVHWTNIFQFILPGNYRILSGWIPPRTRNFLFCQKIATEPPAHSEICHNLGTLAASKFTQVQIRHTLITTINQYELIVIFDSKVTKIKLINLKPRGFENVKIWISDQWNRPAKVILRNFVFQNLPYGEFEKSIIKILLRTMQGVNYSEKKCT